MDDHNNKPVVLAISSDQHTNSTVGLCPPSIELDDGGFYRPRGQQRQLWRHWLQYIERVKEVRDRHGGKLIAIFNGDTTDGDHHKTRQIITRNRSTMVRIASNSLLPLVSESDLVMFTRGTAAHVGNSGEIEEEIAHDLGGWTNNTASYSHERLFFTINGVTLDIAHHAGMGGLPWTYKNAANKVASKSLIRSAEYKTKMPDLVIRSHNHRWADSYDNYPVRAVCVAGWQLRTEFISRIDADAIANIGAIIVTIYPGGTYDVEKFDVPIDRPRPVRLDLEDFSK